MNVETSGRNDESRESIEFYAPAAAGVADEPGWIERFVTSLYNRHRQYVRQIE